MTINPKSTSPLFILFFPFSILLLPIFWFPFSTMYGSPYTPVTLLLHSLTSLCDCFPSPSSLRSPYSYVPYAPPHTPVFFLLNTFCFLSYSCCLYCSSCGPVLCLFHMYVCRWELVSTVNSGDLHLPQISLWFTPLATLYRPSPLPTPGVPSIPASYITIACVSTLNCLLQTPHDLVLINIYSFTLQMHHMYFHRL